jgi:hypothetical protein
MVGTGVHRNRTGIATVCSALRHGHQRNSGVTSDPVDVVTVMAANRGKGTATLVQAVNDLPNWQAPLRGEFGGTDRGGGNRLGAGRLCPEGVLVVGDFVSF